MDTTFKDAGGNRVGFIIGNDIKDSGGNRVGFIVGNDIKDSGGNRIGYLNGTDFKDASGNRVGFINGNDIKDSGGNRVGYAEGSASDIEMCAAGLLLLNLGYAYNNSSASSYSDSTSSESDEQLGRRIILKALVFVFFHFWQFLKAPFVQISWLKKGEPTFRSEWWANCARSLIYSFLLFFLLPTTFNGTYNAGDWGTMDLITQLISGFLLLFFGLLPIILVSISRVRDAGKPWWWALIPGANIIMCGFFPSKY